MKRKLLLPAVIASTISVEASAATFSTIENPLNLSAEEASLINEVMSKPSNEDIFNTLHQIDFQDIDGKIAAARLAVSRHDLEGYRNAGMILAQMQNQNTIPYSNEINEIFLELSGAPEMMLIGFEFESILNSLEQIHTNSVDAHLINATTHTLRRLKGLNRFSNNNNSQLAPEAQALTRLVEVLLMRVMADVASFDHDSRIEFYKAIPTFIEAYSTANLDLSNNFRLTHFLSSLDWQDISGLTNNFEVSSIADALFSGLILEKEVDYNAPSPYFSTFYKQNHAAADIAEYLTGLPQWSPASNYFGSYFMAPGREAQVEELINQQIALYVSDRQNYQYHQPDELQLLDAIFNMFVGGEDRYIGIFLNSMLSASEGVKANYNQWNDPKKHAELERFFDVRLASLSNANTADPMFKQDIHYIFEQMLNNPSTALILPSRFIDALDTAEISKEIASFLSNPPRFGSLYYEVFSQGLNKILMRRHFLPEELNLIFSSAIEGNLNDMKAAAIDSILTTQGFDHYTLQSHIDSLLKNEQYDVLNLVMNRSNFPFSITVDADKFGSGTADKVTNIYVDGYIARRLKSQSHHWTVSFPMLEGSDWGHFNLRVDALMRNNHCTDVTYAIDEDGSGPATPITLPQSHAMNSGRGKLDLTLGSFNLNSQSTLKISSENCGSKQAWIDNVYLEKR